VDITKKSNIKSKFTNFIGGIGYFFCVLQWSWVLVLYFSLLKDFIGYFESSEQLVEPAPVAVTVANPTSPFLFIIGAIVVVFILALTIYMVVKMPSVINKSAKKIVHKSADSFAPLVLRIQKKKDNPRNKIRLTFELILIFKVALIIIPIILSVFSRFVNNQVIDFYIAIWISLFLAGISLISFVIQYILVKLLLIKKVDVA